MDLINRSSRRTNLSRRANGFVLPFVVIFAAIFAIFLLTMAWHVQTSSKNAANELIISKGQSASNEGIQQGLLILNKRISYFKTRILSGFPATGGGVRFMANTDIANYVAAPSSFWTENLNSITENGYPVTNQPDFTVTDANTAAFTVTTDSYVITIETLSGLDLGPIEETGTSGYNNVRLRYGYRITAKEKLTTAQRSVMIESPMRAANMDHLILFHMAKELSRYNLWAENNTTKTGTILYDKTSYTGAVYSKYTFYVDQDPRYSSNVEISNAASPPFSHKTLGASFQFKKPDDSPNPPKIVAPADLPSSADMATMRRDCNRMDDGQNPTAETVPGIYLGTSTIGGVSTVTSIYVNATDGVRTILSVAPASLGVNLWRIEREGGVVISTPQVVATNPSFLFFNEGSTLTLTGTIAEGTKVTINNKEDVLFVGDFQYDSGVMGPNTVAGIVSWEGDILFSKDMAFTPNLDIHGVLMAAQGGIGAEGWQNIAANYTGYAGTVYHKGALIRKWSLPTISSDGKGWGLVTEYDTYLAQIKSPPKFPANSQYKLQDEDSCAVIAVYVRK